MADEAEILKQVIDALEARGASFATTLDTYAPFGPAGMAHNGAPRAPQRSMKAPAAHFGIAAGKCLDRAREHAVSCLNELQAHSNHAQAAQDLHQKPQDAQKAQA